jgi:hypothetical protein
MAGSDPAPDNERVAQMRDPANMPRRRTGGDRLHVREQSGWSHMRERRRTWLVDRPLSRLPPLLTWSGQGAPDLELRVIQAPERASGVTRRSPRSLPSTGSS